MTFPTKADIEFFKEAKRIQELWEPKFGDRVRLAPHDLYGFEDGIIVLGKSDTEDIVVVRTDDHQHLLLYPSELIWLPRQGQLIEMLIEKEGYVILDGPWSDGYNVGISDQPTIDPEDCRWFRGPTPSIALGKCLLEVLDG